MSSPQNTTTEPAAKRQRIKRENSPLSNIPADLFISKVHLFAGPQAVIVVGGEEFMVPRALLCYSSPYFDKALNGNFIEGQEQRVTIEGYPAEAFQMVIQWMYQGTTTLPSRSAEGETGTSASPSRFSNATQKSNTGSTMKISPTKVDAFAITRYLNFLLLADYLQLLGPFKDIEYIINMIVKKNRSALTGEHIRTVMSFPENNVVRDNLIKATVRPYIEHVCWLKKSVFPFQKELDELDGYAGELMREFTKTMKTKTPLSATKGPAADRTRFTVADPFAEGNVIQIAAVFK